MMAAYPTDDQIERLWRGTSSIGISGRERADPPLSAKATLDSHFRKGIVNVHEVWSFMPAVLEHAHIGCVERPSSRAVGAKGDRSMQAGVGRMVDDTVRQNVWQNVADFLDDLPFHVGLASGI